MGIKQFTATIIEHHGLSFLQLHTLLVLEKCLTTVFFFKKYFLYAYLAINENIFLKRKKIENMMRGIVFCLRRNVMLV